MLGDLLRSGRLPAFLVAAGMAVLLYGLLFSNDFLIASVEVRGTQMGDPAEVAIVANAIGESLFRVDASDLADRIALLPYVERVTVETRFPDKVVLHVTEREPALVWQAGGQRLLVDERGNVIGAYQSADLPVLASGAEAPRAGDTVPAESVAAALAIHDVLGDRLQALRLDPVDGLAADLADGREVIFGDASSLPMKLAIFEQVASGGANWSLLDLREPARPYYK